MTLSDVAGFMVLAFASGWIAGMMLGVVLRILRFFGLMN